MQSVAMVRLLLAGWTESPAGRRLNYSTLVQQTLSMAAQHCGAQPEQMYQALCGPGPFADVTPELYARLLRSLGQAELLYQSAAGMMMLTPKGERKVGHYEFYAAFSAPREWRVMDSASGREVGTLMVPYSLPLGTDVLLAGRRWTLTGSDDRARVLEVSLSVSPGRVLFVGDPVEVSGEVRSAMRDVYRSQDVPAWLDSKAAELLSEAREEFRRLGLADRTVVPAGPVSGLHVYPWAGDAALCTAKALLSAFGVESEEDRPCLAVAAGPTDVVAASSEILAECAADPDSAAAKAAEGMCGAPQEKWDAVLDDGLLAQATIERSVDLTGACGILTAASKEAICL